MSELEQLKGIKKMSTLLDSQFKGPFGIKFGLDPIIGLIPLLGPLITRGASLFIIYKGLKISQGSLLLLFRMLFNIILEFFAELVPFIGILFDVYIKANNKNIALLESYIQKPIETRRKIKIHLGVVLCILLALMVIMSVLTYYVLAFVFSLLSQMLA